MFGFSEHSHPKNPLKTPTITNMLLSLITLHPDDVPFFRPISLTSNEQDPHWPSFPSMRKLSQLHPPSQSNLLTASESCLTLPIPAPDSTLTLHRHHHRLSIWPLECCHPQHNRQEPTKNDSEEGTAPAQPLLHRKSTAPIVRIVL